MILKSRPAAVPAAESLPDVGQTPRTGGIRNKLHAEDLLVIPRLLPVYVLKFQNLMAVVNGRTGRVAVTAEKEGKPSKLWRPEPALLTLVFGIYIRVCLHGMLMFAVIAALILFTGCGNGRYSLASRIILRSQSSAAELKGGILYLSKGENALKNPLSNVPDFTEEANGETIPVKIRFYSFGRILDIPVRTAVMVFLPYRIALFIAIGTEKPVETLHIEYGAAWYVPAAVLALTYWIVGVRQDVYNHPLIYEKGKRGKRMGSRSLRKLPILESFGPAGSGRLRKDELEQGEKKELALGAAFMLAILLGSISAILL